MIACGNACTAGIGPGTLQPPPEWAAFDILWKPTWNETLAANSDQRWQDELSGNTGLPPALQHYIEADSNAANYVIHLRKLRLLRALIERFPEDEDQYAAACDAITQTSRKIMLPWWPDPKTSPLGRLEELPENSELSHRLELLAGAARIHGAEQVIQPDTIEGIMGLCDRTNAYLRVSPSHYFAHSAALDRFLRGLSAEQIAPLREAQEKTVRFLARELHGKGKLDKVLRLSRRAPWAHSIHELLLESGERSLLEGRLQWALACFEDVLTHASDPEIRLAAHVGRWLAFSQASGDSAWLESAMAAVPDDAQVPWRGSKVAAGELKKKLLAPEADDFLKLARLARNSIQLPSSWPANEQATDGPRLDFGLHSPWPVSQVQATRDAWIVFSPAIIARFNLDGSGPVWTHPIKNAPWDGVAQENYRKAASLRMTFERRPATPCPAQSPTISNTELTIHYLETSGNQAVIALDAASGRLLWTTSSREDWRGLMPMSRPVAADGRVYVLAIPAGVGANAGQGSGKVPGPPVVWRLVCMDGRDGGLIWERTLGWQPYTLLDLARGAGGLTIHHGLVYASNSMGMVAKCDARDGTVYWVRGYPSAAHPDPRADTFGREGSCPLIADEVLFVAPRDHSGVIAFRSDTGEFLWETIAVPSDRLLGVVGNAVLGINGRHLCALDQKTGRTLWSRQFPEGTASQGAVVGKDVIMASASRLYRIAASNGTTTQSASLAEMAGSTPIILKNGQLVHIKSP